ncbi:MAG: outer membrane beta-barrel protein [Bacteroidota bacterium]
MTSHIKKSLLLSISYLSLTAVIYAQTVEQVPTYSDTKGNVKVNLMYNYSMPMGALKDDVFNNNSPRGFNADVLYWFQPKWSIGGSFGFQDYYQKNPRQVYKLSDGSDISAVLSQSMQTIPVMVKAMYMPGAESSSIIKPYFSAGAGVNLVTFSEYLGEFSSLNNNAAKFTAQAGAGVKFALGKNDKAGILIGANYQYTPYNKYDIKSINSINLQAGVQFRLK